MLKGLFILGILVAATPAGRPTEPLRWLTLDDAQQRLQSQPRVVLMDIYTDWCYWCKVMEQNTYADPRVAAYIQAHFYPVRFNAESQKSVTWKGQSFAYNPNYKVNDLALLLTRGHLAYPTLIFLTGNGSRMLSGYVKPSELEPVLKYFGEGAYLTSSFSTFKKHFRGNWQ